LGRVSPFFSLLRSFGTTLLAKSKKFSLLTTRGHEVMLCLFRPESR